MNQKILVLGATGNIGSQIIRILKGNQAEYVGGVPASELPKLEHAGVNGVAVDFSDPGSLDAAFQGINRLFLLVPMAEPMVNWGRNIVDAAKKNEIEFIVRSSLMDADPRSPYYLFMQHGQIDEYVRASGIPYAVVHPNSFMQNYVVYYRDTIVNDDALYFPYGDAKDSFVDVRNIAAVDAQILMHPEKYANREFTVTGPEALSQNDIAGLLSGAVSRKITYHPVSVEQAEQSMRSSGMSDWEITATMSLNRHIIDGKQAAVTEDVRKVTGREPITFRQFARDNANAWKKVLVHA